MLILTLGTAFLHLPLLSHNFFKANDTAIASSAIKQAQSMAITIAAATAPPEEDPVPGVPGPGKPTKIIIIITIPNQDFFTRFSSWGGGSGGMPSHPARS